MSKQCLSIVAGLMLAIVAAPSHAAVTGPYTADANTLHLWHFDEASGAFADTGNGTTADLADTGGATGRNSTTSGGYGATAYTGFGNAFDVLDAGTGAYHPNKSSIGGGATTGVGVAQSTLQDATTGAYTWEALVFADSGFVTADERTILSHDGPLSGSSTSGTRGPMLRVVIDSGNPILNWFNGQSGNTKTAALPTGTDDHAFAIGEWFHVAVTYTGVAGAADNFKFYWTALDSGATEANLLATFTQAADAADATAADNHFGVGTITRDAYRKEWEGLIDEVRISDVVRGPSDFIFAVPTPAALPAGLVLLSTLVMRRRHLN